MNLMLCIALCNRPERHANVHSFASSWAHVSHPVPTLPLATSSSSASKIQFLLLHEQR